MEDSPTMRNLSFQSGNRFLPGRVFGSYREDSGKPGLLFVHGDGSSQAGYEDRARSASAELDVICLTFDLSGHGSDSKNRERYSVYEHLEDTFSAYDCLVSQRGVDEARIGVCGASYGAYLSALLTAHRTVKLLLLRAPTLIDKVRFPKRSRLPAYEQDPSGFDSLEILRRYLGKVLILEGARDCVIPHAYIEAYLKTISKATHHIIDAEHVIDRYSEPFFVKEIMNWFKDL